MHTQSKCNGSNQANICPTMKGIQIAKLAQKKSSNCKGTFIWCDVGIAGVAVHCTQRCVLPVFSRLIYYYDSNKSTGKETVKSHLCALVQFSKFNNFLRVCWFLSKNLSNFVSLVMKLHNHSPHCASLGGQQNNYEKIIFQKINFLIYFFCEIHFTPWSRGSTSAKHVSSPGFKSPCSQVFFHIFFTEILNRYLLEAFVCLSVQIIPDI